MCTSWLARSTCLRGMSGREMSEMRSFTTTIIAFWWIKWNYKYIFSSKMKWSYSIKWHTIKKLQTCMEYQVYAGQMLQGPGQPRETESHSKYYTMFTLKWFRVHCLVQVNVATKAEWIINNIIWEGSFLCLIIGMIYSKAYSRRQHWVFFIL